MTDRRSDIVHEQAVAWLMRWHEGAIGLEEELELELWLDSDPAHAAALAEAARAWRAAGLAAGLPELAGPRADAITALHAFGNRSGRVRGRIPRQAFAGIAACMALVVAVLLYVYPAQVTYRTGVGERRGIPLADGSRLSLDAASAVEVRYDAERRALRLLSGRGRFDVAKDPRRPFAVTVGDRMVVATGTAFSVELLGAETRVILYEGSVALLDDGPANAPPRHVMLQGRPETPAERALMPGTAMVVPNAPMAAAHIEQIDAARTLLWEQGQLVFADEPLGVAIERVNRYSTTRLTVADAATAALPVSGAFNAGDTESFVDGVTTLYGLRKQHHGDTIVLASAAP